MRATPRTISLMILLGAMLGLAVGVLYTAHRRMARARGLLDSVRSLEANSDGTRQMEALAEKYALQKRCQKKTCVYYALVQNPITLQRLRAPAVEMSFSVRVDDDRLALMTITLTSTDSSRDTSVGVSVREDFQPVAGQPSARVHQLGGEGGRGVRVIIEFTPAADASVKEAAFDLNTSCLSRLRSCSAKDLAPKAFSLPNTP